MANRTATLYIRITKSGKSSFCKPVYQSKGRLKPQFAIVKGEPEHHREGVYYLRFGADDGKQQFVLVGKDPYVALDKLAEKQRWLRDRERRVTPQKPVNSKPESSRISVDEAVEQYFKNLHSQGTDPKTIRAYKVAVEECESASIFPMANGPTAEQCLASFWHTVRTTSRHCSNAGIAGALYLKAEMLVGTKASQF